uniref:Uncharacterized protein n=1 Tax=Physcomitrium patens TaxID=3218 RepID=A0A7I4CBP7_PHYPA
MLAFPTTTGWFLHLGTALKGRLVPATRLFLKGAEPGLCSKSRWVMRRSQEQSNSWLIICCSNASVINRRRYQQPIAVIRCFDLKSQQEDGSQYETAAQDGESDYTMLSVMKTAYDELSILESAESSSSKYAGFTLLVNNSAGGEG